ncbi:MAG: beta-galactosidase [Lentisphaeria bacterium]|jgi:hypothetical protein|nr:beta-galactosidase [Lentisphaeria bacterium]
MTLHRVALVGLSCLLGGMLMADETELLFGPGTEAKWDTARDENRLRQELSEHGLAPEADGLRWRFVSKEPKFNDIFLRREVRAPFSEVVLRVRNDGSAVQLALKARDAGGAEWTVPALDLPSGEEATLRFARKDWAVASWSKDADGQFDFPLAWLTVIAFGVEPGQRYDLLIREVAAVRPDPPVATVHSLAVPGELRAGETARFSAEFTFDKACLTPRAFAELHQAGEIRFRMPLDLAKPLDQLEPGERIRLADVPLPVPRFVRGGAASFTLRLGEAHLVRDGKQVDDELASVRIQARQPGPLSAHVRLHGGVPTLFINDQPHSGLAYTAYGPDPKVFADFAAAGVNLFSICATPTESGYGLSRTTWKAPEVYDFSQLDERIQMVLSANPEAYIFPRLYLHAPKWWSEAHPDDIVQFDSGDGVPRPFIHSGGLPAPSWASEAWRQATIEGLRRLIEHVQTSPYADRVIGYHLASGTTEEWMMWGANEREWVDFSPANRDRFRAWLRDRYRTDAALQAAWGRPDATLATVAIPTRREREESAGSLRDAAAQRHIVDFYLYNSFLVADTIEVFARATKEFAGRDRTVGVFYGYLLQLCGEQRQQNAGHLALGQVLACPDVDFVCSPSSYAFRQLGGEGTSHFMSLLDSVKLHGKLWFNENDIRTSLSPGKPGGWGKPDDVAGDVLQQDKDLANAFANGAAQWWFDVGRNRYDDPGLMARIAGYAANGPAVLAADRSPVDQIALVVDEKSLCHLRVGDRLGRHLLVGHLPQLQRCGAPVGHYLTSDLPALTRHRLLVLPVSFAPDERQRENLEKLKGDGRVLVFLYAPGVYQGDTLDAAAAEAFCGIRLKQLPGSQKLRVTLASGDSYGADEEVAPVFVADDPAAEVLGTLPDGSPGLVVKRFPTWTAVFSAAPLPPATLLRQFADRAGVHGYTPPGDVVWASRDLLAVGVNEAGPRQIQLPRRVHEVVDLYTGETVARDTAEFTTEFPARATHLFLLR